MIEFLQAAAALLQLLPALVPAIQTVENALPNASGKDKLNTVMNQITIASQVGGAAVGAFAPLFPLIEKSISSIVAAFHATGVFQHRADKAQSAPLQDSVS